MSEFFRKFENSLRERNERRRERAQERTARKTANDALVELSQTEYEPLVSYKQGTESIVDLTKMTAGTIFRTESHYHFNSVYSPDRFYLWFAVGMNEGKGKYMLFRVYWNDDDDIFLDRLPRLVADEKYNLARVHPSKDSFSPDEAKFVLLGEKPNPLFPLYSLDVMSAGIKSKKPVEEAESARIKLLNPFPSEMGI